MKVEIKDSIRNVAEESREIIGRLSESRNELRNNSPTYGNETKQNNIAEPVTNAGRAEDIHSYADVVAKEPPIDRNKLNRKNKTNKENITGYTEDDTETSG